MLAENNLSQETQVTTGQDTKNHKKGLTFDEIHADLLVIHFAGHNTTANMLAFTMFLLAGHPEVQGWQSEEITSVTKYIPIDK